LSLTAALLRAEFIRAFGGVCRRKVEGDRSESRPVHSFDVAQFRAAIDLYAPSGDVLQVRQANLKQHSKSIRTLLDFETWKLLFTVFDCVALLQKNEFLTVLICDQIKTNLSVNSGSI
jgi:hypothetical protein